MILLLVDQNFNEHIVEGLIQREPSLDIVHVRNVGLAAAPDPAVLELASAQDRVLLTHDRRTIPSFAYDRVATGQAMPGIFLVNDDMSISQAIEELRIAVHCLTEEECKDMINYFPL